MLGSAAVARVQQLLGWRSDKSTEILAALNEAQDELETGRTLPIFLKEEDATLVFAADEYSIALPSGFIKIVKDEQPYRVDASSGDVTFLVPTDFKRGMQLYGSAEAGDPVAYAIRESTIRIFPATSEALTLTYSYWKHADDITSGAENSWLANYPYVIIGMGALKIARDIRDSGAVKNAEAMLLEWRPRMLSGIIERETDERDFFMGDEQ